MKAFDLFLKWTTEKQIKEDSEIMALASRANHNPNMALAFLGGYNAAMEEAGALSSPRPEAHDLYKDGDADAPDSIKDRNGQVVLGLCRKCGRAESELSEPCSPRPEAREEAKELATRIFDGIALRVDQFFKSNDIQGGVRCGDDLFSPVDKIELAKSIEAYALSRLATPKPEAREESVNDFRADELDAVMVSVDKWFDEGDPRLRQDPANRSADAREIALKAIESSRLAAPKPEGQWISVRDRLPDIGVFVLCYSRYSWCGVARRFDDVPGCPFEWIDEGANYIDSRWITHWMPLPAAPAPGTKGEA